MTHSTMVRGWLGVPIAIATVTQVQRPAQAQNIVLDGSLGPAETLQANSNQVYNVNQALGSTVGENLFHSFTKFDLVNGEKVRFSSDNSIRNILGRITGGSASSIDGTLITTEPSVNLFLINPNGISFGPKAELQVKGSFVATTLDSLSWPDGSRFDALMPEGNSSLLNIVGDPSGFIASQRPIPAVEVLPEARLFTKPGHNLILLGGDVLIDQARLELDREQAGLLALGGLLGPGEVELTQQGNDWQLTFPEDVLRGNVSISSDPASAAPTKVFARANIPGRLEIYGHDVDVLGGSQVSAGVVEQSPASSTNQSGQTLLIDAQGKVTVQGEDSTIENRFSRGSLGNTGNVEIIAEALEVSDGGVVQTATSGEGNVGDVVLRVSDRIIIQEDGKVASLLFSEATGQGGDVIVDTTSLEVLTGGRLQAESFGKGNAGIVQIDASESVRFVGRGLDQSDSLSADGSTTRPSGAFSKVSGDEGVGDGGAVIINTALLEVLDGAQIRVNTFVEGDAGDVTINASDRVLLDGRHEGGQPSGIVARVGDEGMGDGGDIRINTNMLEVLNGAEIQAETRSQGDAGNIYITANEQVRFVGTGLSEGQQESSSAAISRVSPTGEGQGGNITIQTANLEVLNGARLFSDTEGMGDAGDISITASNSVLLRGENADGRLTSAISNQVGPTGEGNGGEIIIRTSTLEVLDGAGLRGNTIGQGDAGNVTIQASESALFQGSSKNGVFHSGAFSRVQRDDKNGHVGVGNGGTLSITAPTLEILAGAQLRANSLGQGDAGNVVIQADNFVRFDGSDSFGYPSTAVSRLGPTGIGEGGDVSIDTGTLEVLNGAEVQAETLGQGDAGNIYISASDLVCFQGARTNDLGFQSPSQASSRVGDTGEGQGGNVEISAAVLEVLDGAQLRANTKGMGDAGGIQIVVGDRILLDGFNPVNQQVSSLVTSNGDLDTNVIGQGKGGDIEIQAPQLTISNGANINARTINSQTGGDISLNLDRLTINSGGKVLTTSDASGPAGSIFATATEKIGIANLGSELSVRSNANDQGAVGAAGDIVLNSALLTLQDWGQIIAESTTGDGGNIIVGRQQQGMGEAAVAIPPAALLLGSNSFISTTAGDSQNPGDGGNIVIESPFLIGFPDGNSNIVANAFEGDGGRITIDAEAILNFDLQAEPDVGLLRANATNDISASSALGAPGILNLAGLNVDPSQGSAALPSVPTPDNQVDQTCSAVALGENEFTVSGRGGIPLTPQEPQTAAEPNVAWVPLPDEQSARVAAQSRPRPRNEAPATPVREALSWYRDGAGKVVLAAVETASQAQSLIKSAPRVNHSACQHLSSNL